MSAQTDHTDLLRRAAAKARETAKAAPRGPYTVDTRRTVDDTRILFADDGDAFAVATDWAGGHGIDTGTPEQTAAHITLWHPGVALAVATWLESWDGIDLNPSGPLPADYEHVVNVARALLNEPKET